VHFVAMMFGCRGESGAEQVVAQLDVDESATHSMATSNAIAADEDTVGNIDVVDNEVELAMAQGRQTIEDDDEISALCQELQAMCKHTREMCKETLPASFDEQQRQNIVSMVLKILRINKSNSGKESCIGHEGDGNGSAGSVMPGGVWLETERRRDENSAAIEKITTESDRRSHPLSASKHEFAWKIINDFHSASQKTEKK
jgi:hypothetical protein